MIVLDLETSGLFPEENGIWQLGAIDLDNPTNCFLEECRLDDDEKYQPQVLQVTGRTESDLRDKNKQSQKQLLESFGKWLSNIKNKTLICQIPSFDIAYLGVKSRKHKVKLYLSAPLDLHTIAAAKYYSINKKFSLKQDGSASNFSLGNILAFCGIKDERIKVNNATKQIIKEGTPHNALEDCKLTAECFSRIVYGKELFEEFKGQSIPDYLR